MSGPDTSPERLDGVESDREDTRRRILRTDGLAGLAAVLVGVFEGRDGLLVPELGAVAVVLCLATASVLYLIEHDAVPGVYPEVASVVGLVVLVGIGGGFVWLLARPTALIAAAAVAGTGVGILGYRFVFGILRPIPAERLKLANK